MQKVKKICLFVSFWSEFSSDDYGRVEEKKVFYFLWTIVIYYEVILKNT